MRRQHRGRGHDGGGGGHDSAGGLRWLLTYADMITLLMAFFIMMYAISYLDLKKFDALAQTFHQIFGGGGQVVQGGQGVLDKGTPQSEKPFALPLVMQKPPDLQSIEEGLEKFIERHNLAGKVLVWREERGLVVSLLTDGVFFSIGSADLSPKAKDALRAIADLIHKWDRPVRIEGHTCDLPIHSDRYPSNWELSTARAASVARFFIEKGALRPSALSVAGYAQYRPLLPNTSEVNRRLNRRVDIVLLTGAEASNEPRAVEESRQ